MYWVEEIGKVNLGDKRRSKRLVTVVKALSSSPQESIPHASEGWAETKGAYRLLKNDAVDWRLCLDEHIKNSLKRILNQKVILCIQDTTELDFSSHPSTSGLGRLNYEARQGMYLHPTMLVNPEGQAFGVSDAWMWARKPKGAASVKESDRWIEGYERIAELAKDVPNTRLVYVADRESDIRGLMDKANDLDYPADFLIRSKHNRKLNDSDKKCWESVENSGVLATIEFTLPAAANRPARKVKQALYSQRVIFGGKTALEVTAILAREINPPNGQKAIEWKLLTNRVARIDEEIIELIQWYQTRWMIEIFFHILKSGCTIESIQLSSLAQIERLLVIYLIIGWRILYLLSTGRKCPDLPCDVAFDTQEWHTIWIISNKTKPPKTAPKLGDMILMLACIGGFLGRKSDGLPGPKPIWKGLQKVRDHAVGIELAKNVFGLSG